MGVCYPRMHWHSRYRINWIKNIQLIRYPAGTPRSPREPANIVANFSSGAPNSSNRETARRSVDRYATCRGSAPDRPPRRRRPRRWWAWPVRVESRNPKTGPTLLAETSIRRFHQPVNRNCLSQGASRHARRSYRLVACPARPPSATFATVRIMRLPADTRGGSLSVSKNSSVCSSHRLIVGFYAGDMLHEHLYKISRSEAAPCEINSHSISEIQPISPAKRLYSLRWRYGHLALV